MISGVTADLSTLVRGEIELVKAELRDTARTAGKGGGLVAGAVIVGSTGALFLLLTIAWLLDEWLPTWAGFGIVTLVLIIVAVVLGLVGRNELEKVKGPELSPESIQKDKELFARNPFGSKTTADPADTAGVADAVAGEATPGTGAATGAGDAA
jgi:Na+-transporting methylmalonyl-CoA/oxaloacetate decarboxylase gamma subunit